MSRGGRHGPRRRGRRHELTRGRARGVESGMGSGLLLWLLLWLLVVVAAVLLLLLLLVAAGCCCCCCDGCGAVSLRFIENFSHEALVVCGEGDCVVLREQSGGQQGRRKLGGQWAGPRWDEQSAGAALTVAVAVAVAGSGAAADTDDCGPVVRRGCHLLHMRCVCRSAATSGGRLAALPGVAAVAAAAGYVRCAGRQVGGDRRYWLCWLRCGA